MTRMLTGVHAAIVMQNVDPLISSNSTYGSAMTLVLASASRATAATMTQTAPVTIIGTYGSAMTLVLASASRAAAATLSPKYKAAFERHVAKVHTAATGVTD